MKLYSSNANGDKLAPLSSSPAPRPRVVPEHGAFAFAASMSVAAVLDTNAVLDWLVFGDPRVQPLADAITAGRVVWVATEPMRAELLHVLPRLAQTRWRPDPAHVGRMHRAFATEWTGSLPPLRPGLRCRDAADQKFVDLALAAEARWLVSHDRALLDLSRPAGRRGLSIVRPADWTEVPR